MLHRLPNRRGGFDHIEDLRHTLELKVWNESYTDEGDYDANLAKAAFGKYKDAEGAPKRAKRKAYKRQDE